MRTTLPSSRLRTVAKIPRDHDFSTQHVITQALLDRLFGFDHTQKKTHRNTSYASTSILPRTHSLAPCRATKSSLRTLQSSVLLLCIHKQQTACSYSLNICCACTDKRPSSDNHTVRLIDVPDDGSVQIEIRAEHYCPNYQAMIQMLQSSRNTTDREVDFWARHTVSSSFASTPGPHIASSDHNTIMVSCAAGVFDLTRLNCTTRGELQCAAALLMRYYPSELIYIANDVDLERGPDALGLGLAAYLAYAVHIRFGIRCRTWRWQRRGYQQKSTMSTLGACMTCDTGFTRPAAIAADAVSANARPILAFYAPSRRFPGSL